jgi:hypothetical protein
MPIDRAPWTALIDDDGSNLVGTVWNKDKIKTVILDPTDAAFMPAAGVDNQTTGTVHNWVPPGIGKAPAGIVYWYGGADVLLTGIAAGVPGQLLTIVNRAGGGPILRLAHNHSGSTGPNQINCLVTSGVTPVANMGYVQLQYNNQWFILGHEQGAWITMPYSAADFTAASPMTWTVTAANVIQRSYRLSGRTLQYSVWIDASALTGTAAGTITVALPFQPRGIHANACSFFSSTAPFALALAYHDLATPKVIIGRDPTGLSLPLGTFYLYLTATCEVT